MTDRIERPTLTEGPYGVGDVVDARYELIRPVGRGGMGTVWVAHDRVLEIHVALKVVALVQPGMLQRQLSDRMLREAQSAAKLGHPAICRVLNFGTTQFGDPYIASELLDGETLADVMELAQRLTAIDAVRILLPIVEGLEAAHARGIIHRDVKPENIFMARGDRGRSQPKLLDFGIARVLDSTNKITIEGALLGTPDYMSPETARGSPKVDARSDVWSVCVVLYELVTGEVPFVGENYNAVLWAVAHEEPTSILVHNAGDQELWAIVARGLAKDPDARWQSMRELGEALATWAHERGVTEDVCQTSLRSGWLARTPSSGPLSYLSSLPPNKDTFSSRAPSDTPELLFGPATFRPPRNPTGDEALVAAMDPFRGQAETGSSAGVVKRFRSWAPGRPGRTKTAAAAAGLLLFAGGALLWSRPSWWFGEQASAGSVANASTPATETPFVQPAPPQPSVEPTPAAEIASGIASAETEETAEPEGSARPTPAAAPVRQAATPPRAAATGGRRAPGPLSKPAAPAPPAPPAARSAPTGASASDLKRPDDYSLDF